MQLACSKRIPRNEYFNLFAGLQPLWLQFTLFCSTFIIANPFLAHNTSQRTNAQFKPESSILVGNYKKAKERTCMQALYKAITLHFAKSQIV